MRNANAALLAVTGQHFLACRADLGAVGLQTAKNPQNIIWINLQLGLTVLGHVRMTGGAFLRIALVYAHAFDGRRLRRQCLSVARGCNDK